MGRTIIKVVEVVAPIALQALAQAAMALIAAPAMADGAEEEPGSPAPVADVQDNGSIIQQDTTKYVTDQFQDNFRYFFQGLGSNPPGAKLPLVGASQDIIVWDPSKNEQTDLQSYITNVLQGTLQDSDTIMVAQNIAQLFQARFTEIDLSWSPFMKRYNLPASAVTIDLQMVTAAGYDQNKNPLGIATFCFTAYNSTT